MSEKRMIHKAVKMLYANRTEGDLLMDSPATDSWEELKKLAFADDKKEWRRRVRAIKDTVHIQATKGKGEKKRQRTKSNNDKAKKNSEATKKKNKKGASAATAVQTPTGSEASEEPSESEDDEWRWQ